MHPDKTLMNDLGIFLLGAFSVLILILIATSSGYPPADECANMVRNSLSPYQAQQLVDTHEMPPSYNTARQWCANHLDTFHRDIQQAQSWRQFKQDMY